MQLKSAFYICIYFIAIIAESAYGGEWLYKFQRSWYLDYVDCNKCNWRQSPIHLNNNHKTFKYLRDLRFENYDEVLKGPLTLVNTGHDVNIDLPATRNGKRPSISRGQLFGTYEAIGLHFHWGSIAIEGSEHMIDGKKYDVEMHIVHRYVGYDTNEIARKNSDGFVVLAVMLQRKEFGRSYKIFEKLPRIIKSGSKTTITDKLSLNDFLDGGCKQDFFAYEGSYTTPPCSEAVSWHILTKPIPIKDSLIRNFFDLQGSDGSPIRHNYRGLQKSHHRLVFRHKNC